MQLIIFLSFSAGIGRTGTFLAVHMALQKIASGHQLPEIEFVKKIVINLRKIIMVRPIIAVATLGGLGYTIAITLIILSCTNEESCGNLLLLAPYLFMPVMTAFIRSDAEDSNSWAQFAVFMITICIVSSFAIPIVLYVNDSITSAGLGYGLGASFILHFFLAVAMYFVKKSQYYYY